ncbi:MAG: hypothetical protein E6Q97_04275 [Desulfurellales bacterium]|nr:MAG: hypothetical protein E6Q97_04275 [Desulfurellales bacterium]
MNDLNEWTGRSNRWLQERHSDLVSRLRSVREITDDYDGHGGSPGEHIMEEIDAIQAELWRRGVGKPN